MTSRGLLFKSFLLSRCFKRENCRDELNYCFGFDFGSSRTCSYFSLLELLPLQAPVLTCCPSPLDDFEEILSDNRTAFLRSVADDLRQRLPLDAMLPSESTAYSTVPRPERGRARTRVGEGRWKRLKMMLVFPGGVADAATLSADGARRCLLV